MQMEMENLCTQKNEDIVIYLYLFHKNLYV